MAKEKKFCHICGNRVKDENAAVCPSCGADLFNPQSEAIASASDGYYMKGALNNIPGSAVLTNQRLLFFATKNQAVAGAVGGLVGSLVASAVAGPGGKLVFSVPLGDIVSVADGKRKNVMTVTTRDGTSYNISIQNIDEWKNYLRSLPGVTS